MKHSNLENAIALPKTLLNAIIAILKRLLPDYAEDKLKNDETRDFIVKQVDALLIAEVPAAALIPRSTRHSLIRHVLDELPLPEVAAQTVAKAAADMAGNIGAVIVADGDYEQKKSAEISLGVRSITVQLAQDANEKNFRLKAGEIALGWEVKPMGDGLNGFYTLRPPREKMPMVSEAWGLACLLSKIPGVESAEPAIRQLPEVPDGGELADGVVAAGAKNSIRFFGMQDHNVPETKNQPTWSLDMVKVQQLWTNSDSGKGVLIGHIDTGYTRHPEIIQNLRTDLGYDTWDDDKDTLDDLDPSFWDNIRSKIPVASPGHGTATSSVIASPVGWQASLDAPQPVCGTAPKASIIPIRATPTVVILPTGSLEEVARGIMKAVHNGAKVISMSLGSPWEARELKLAVNQALNSGVIVCAAAGNVVLAESWLTGVTYPAAYPGVIAVAGCDYHGRPWRDSCRGKEVVVTAPGTDVWHATAERKGTLLSTEVVFSTGQGSGTSFAVATVAGIAACWLNFWGGWDKLLDEFKGNKRSIPQAFLECLRQHKATPIKIPSPPEPDDLKDYPHFDPNDFGVGIINVPELLNVKPSDLHINDSLQPAAAVDVVPNDDSAKEILFELQRHFGGSDDSLDDSLSEALSKDLGLKLEDLPEFLRLHGRELLHHVAVSREIRGRLYDITQAHPPSSTDANATVVGGVASHSPDISLAKFLRIRGSTALNSALLNKPDFQH